MRITAFIACAIVLSGCLLKQNDPMASVPVKAFIEGEVTLEDLVIGNQGELVVLDAEFSTPDPVKPATPANGMPKPEPVASTLLASGMGSLETRAERSAAARALFTPSDSATRAPTCSKAKALKVAPTPAPTARAAAPAAPTVPNRAISVGNLGFGPALQTALEVLTPFKNLKYQAVLQPRIPAGAYVVVAEGTEEVESFNELLSVPEDIRHLRLNGLDFGDPMLEFQPDRALEVYWRAPAVTNDQNRLILQVIHSESDTVYRVGCSLAEDDIPSLSGYKTWTLDKNWFAEFPRTGKVNFYFIRAHVRKTATKRSKMATVGTRTFYSHLDVATPVTP